MIILIGYVNRPLYSPFYSVATHKFNFDRFHASIIKEKLEKELKGIKGTDKTIVITSCREEIFNIIGHKIAKKHLDLEDVHVVLYDKDGVISNHPYNEDGMISHFPYGFFSWTDD